MLSVSTSERVEALIDQGFQELAIHMVRFMKEVDEPERDNAASAATEASISTATGTHSDNSSVVASTTTSNIDKFREFSWYEPMWAQAKTKAQGEEKPSVMASASGGLIRWRDMCANFYQAIEEPTNETTAIGFELFDHYGNFRDKHKTSRSQVWSHELDRGDILILELIRVDKAFRRQGLATLLYKSLTNTAQNKSKPDELIAVAGHGAVNGEIGYRIQGKALAVAIDEQPEWIGLSESDGDASHTDPTWWKDNAAKRKYEHMSARSATEVTLRH
ncbi:hypothetical protein MN608_11161 [Microdochium nivale]|nr:hypothetical protein MN608_11161 [Microdochium nivale]